MMDTSDPRDDLDAFESRVYADCNLKGLFPPNARILLALSGGPDSTALFYSFLKLTQKWKSFLGIAHLNHKTRGQESDSDAQFVLNLAKEKKVPSHYREIEASNWIKESGYSFQEGARILRLSFFEELAEGEGYDFIALGHHADDQAETVLMNLLRGTGIRGLSGIPFQRGKIIHPLLHRRRSEILDYLMNYKIDFKTDSSNQDNRYLRNRVRRELIPKLEKDFSPGLRKHLANLATIAGEDEEFLSELAEGLFEKNHEFNDKELFLSRSELKDLPAALLNRVLRRAVREIKGNLQAVDYSHIQAVARLVFGESSRAVILPGDIRVSLYKDNDRILFSIQSREREGSESVIQGIFRLNIPGITEIESAELAFEAKVNPSIENYKDAGPNEGFFDLDRVGESVWVRFSEPGDRFWPLGSPGTKKLKSFFIDQKIPVEERRCNPILTDASGNIIWVYGKRISERFKLVPKTTNVLYLKGVS